MTTEERIAALERRVSSLEHVTLPMTPLGPDHRHAETLEAERKEAVQKIAAALRERGVKMGVSVPVDRSCRVLTDGSPVTEDHRDINPATGQQKDYVVLCDAERAKGFVRPVRRTYTHAKCGGETTMGVSLAETYARDPSFYSGTFCAFCRAHFTLDEFVWTGTTEQVGS